MCKKTCLRILAFRAGRGLRFGDAFRGSMRSCEQRNNIPIPEQVSFEQAESVLVVV